MRATIVDIAKLTGVSRTTVSNILNGKFKCSGETKERVLEAARSLDYQPNCAARTLVQRRSDLVGLVLPNYVDGRALLSSPFYNYIVDAISQGLGDAPSRDLLLKSRGPEGEPLDLSGWVRKRNVEGLILVGDWDARSLRGVEGIPLVFIDNYEPDAPGLYLNIDDSGGAYMATRHLQERGYRKIAFCGCALDASPVNRKRWEGYRGAQGEAGLPEELVQPEGLGFEEGRAAAQRIASSGADAVFAVNDSLALGLLKGLSEAGISVPGDIGLVGFDNLPASAQSSPGLSTIDQDIYGKGTEALRLLLRAMEGGQRSGRILLPLRLMARESSGGPKEER